MPDPTPKKKVVVKVLKKTTPKMDESVPKGLTKSNISKIDEITKFNAKAMAVEGRAKSDSISGANRAKFSGKDLVDQKRAGNASANVTRVKEGNPQVLRGRQTNTEPDKYYTGGYSSLTSDSYSRSKPLEKDMPKIGGKGITLTPEKKDSDKKK